MAEHVQQDTFYTPHHKMRPSIEFKLNDLLKEYASQFTKDEMSIWRTSITEMTINMDTSDPVSQEPYPIAMKNNQWVQEEIEKLLMATVIYSRSSCSVPIIVVTKGDGGKWLVIDYSALNKVTRKFTWPMPKAENIFGNLNGAKYFSTLDLWASYHHIPLDKSLNTQNGIQLTFWQIWICQGTIWTCSGSSIFSRTIDWNSEGFWLCKSILGWHNNLQQNSRNTPIQHQTYFWEIMSCKNSPWN